MSDLIEAMARGLHAIEGSWNDYEWEYLPPTVQQLFMEQATAALAALRETHHLVPKDQEPVTAEAVRNAYYEGYGDGVCVGPIWEDANAGWEASGARQALGAKP